MKVTIVYDNRPARPDLAGDWGFACIVDAHEKRILFDTGAKGAILMDHLRTLEIDPASVDAVFISHDHWDHTGGLAAFLERRQVPVYVPAVCADPPGVETLVRLDEPREIAPGLFSTGELGKMEQSLVVRTGPDTTAVIVGCSHPGVGNILDAAASVGTPTALLGGLHGFSDFERLEPLERICPVHCTQRLDEILQRFPETAVAGGAGAVFEFPNV
jgi:7,8-dihydropterin-6-yl-methyl-4-(beta-D-ribofuranosyl)aminobenzene 5'-phosphate synthase